MTTTLDPETPSFVEPDVPPETPPTRGGASTEDGHEDPEARRKRREAERARRRYWAKRGQEQPPREGEPSENDSETHSQSAQPSRRLFGARERRPKGPKSHKAKPKRESIAPLGTFVWRQVGAMLEQTVYYPSGRIMLWQALAAGEVLDELAEGTWVDEHGLQPLMRQEKKVEAAAMLLGPPILAGMMARNPAAATSMAPMMRFVVRQSLVVMLPAMEKAKRREAEELRLIAELFGDTLPPDTTVDDVVESLLAEMFAPPKRPQAAEPEEAVA
jgi:hypothetical protein